MRIIISEQQASQILDMYKNLIEKILDQKEILYNDVVITPSFFPDRGIKIIVKLQNPSDKPLVRELVKGLTDSLTSFGKREVSLR